MAFFIGSIILGCISFVMFLLFYKKLKPVQLLGNIGPAFSWIIIHFIIGIILRTWRDSTPFDYKIMYNNIGLIFFITTSCIMWYLARKLKINKKHEIKSSITMKFAIVWVYIFSGFILIAGLIVSKANPPNPYFILGIGLTALGIPSYLCAKSMWIVKPWAKRLSIIACVSVIASTIMLIKDTHNIPMIVSISILYIIPSGLFFIYLIKVKVDSYDYIELKNAIEPILELLERGDIPTAEKQIAQFVLKYSEEVKRRRMKPSDGDSFVSYLFIEINDMKPKIALRTEVHDLLLEGTCLHQYGSKHPPNFELIKKLANKIIGTK